MIDLLILWFIRIYRYSWWAAYKEVRTSTKFHEFDKRTQYPTYKWRSDYEQGTKKSNMEYNL